jgi:cell wall assembly regulator SMI1
MLALELFDDYVSWLRVNVPLAYKNLAPPATSSELDALEEALGCELPLDVKAVLAVHNGQKSTMTASRPEHAVPCLPTLSFLSTALIRECWDEWAIVRRDPDLDSLQEIGATFPGAEGRIERCPNPLTTNGHRLGHTGPPPGHVPLGRRVCHIRLRDQFHNL